MDIQMMAKGKAAPAFAFGLPGGANILGEFDPAGFLEGKDQDTVYKYREAELTHGRVAMLASVGFIVQEKFHPLFSGDGGPAVDQIPRLPVAIWFLMTLGIGACEALRIQVGWSNPNDPDHVVYVWVDALTNYLTAIGFPDGAWEASWRGATHVVGKDILRFHAVYWPAMLLAAGLPPPKKIYAHGWWTKDGSKISKSTGNVVVPSELIDEYGLDATRFFLLSEIPFGADGDFSRTAMLASCSSCFLQMRTH